MSLGRNENDDWDDLDDDDDVEQLKYCDDCGELTQDCVCDLLDEWG